MLFKWTALFTAVSGTIPQCWRCQSLINEHTPTFVQLLQDRPRMSRRSRNFRTGGRSFHTNVRLGVARGPLSRGFTATPLPLQRCNNNASSRDTTTAMSPVTDNSLNSDLGSSPTNDEIREYMRSVNSQLQSLDEKTISLTNTVKELADLMRKHCKNSFVIKGSPFEVSYNYS